jgi:hypothetical protein
MTKEDWDRAFLEQDRINEEKAVVNEVNRGNVDFDKKHKQLGFIWWYLYPLFFVPLHSLISMDFPIFFVTDSNVLSIENHLLVEYVLPIQLVLSTMILFNVNYAKYAFLLSSFLTFNLSLLVINSYYIYNRWCYPKLNNGIDCDKPVVNHHKTNAQKRKETLKKFEENEKSELITS